MSPNWQLSSEFWAIVGASRPLPGETTDQYNARQDWDDEDCTKIFRIFRFHLGYKKISKDHDVTHKVSLFDIEHLFTH